VLVNIDRIVSVFAQSRKCWIGHGRLVDRDTRAVVEGLDTPRMTVHLICPWCADEVAFEVDRDSDELLCSACGTSFDFAPDPAVTYALLYEAA
jgi:hypothetical protein